MDDDVAAIVVDNGSGSVQSNNESNAASADGAAITNRYARLRSDGIVIIIQNIRARPRRRTGNYARQIQRWARSTDRPLMRSLGSWLAGGVKACRQSNAS